MEEWMGGWTDEWIDRFIIGIGPHSDGGREVPWSVVHKLENQALWSQCRKFIYWNPNHQCDRLGGVIFGRWLGPEDRALMHGICVLIKENLQSPLTPLPHENTARRLKPCTTERALRRTPSCLDLELPQMRNKNFVTCTQFALFC